MIIPYEKVKKAFKLLTLSKAPLPTILNVLIVGLFLYLFEHPISESLTSDIWPKFATLITVVFKLRKAFEKRKRLFTGTFPVNNKTTSLAGQSVSQSISFKTSTVESV